MKKSSKIILLFILCFVFLWGNASVIYATDGTYTNSFSLSNGSSIAIDGEFSDWDTLPCSYEYNWDNSQNCWYWGVWINEEECYKTEPGTYSTDVRHKMQMYCDGEYVYLHIIYGRNYINKINGDDFQFYVGGEMAAFQVVTQDGEELGTTVDDAPGIYPVEIRHRDTKLSFLGAEGTNGYLLRTEDNINNELEIRIPLIELQRQNPNINVETLGTIEFHTPNLMYRRISAVGTSSGPIALAAMCGGVVLCGLLLRKRKKDGNL